LDPVSARDTHRGQWPRTGHVDRRGAALCRQRCGTVRAFVRVDTRELPAHRRSRVPRGAQSRPGRPCSSQRPNSTL